MHNLTESKGSLNTRPQQRSHTTWLDAEHDKDIWAADLVDQYHGLGMSRPQASRLFEAVYVGLVEVLEGIDHHALAAAPMPEQVSMLSPRFDVERLASSTGVDRAQVQTAVAMLVLEFVMHNHLSF